MDETYGYYIAELFMIPEYSIVLRSLMKKQPVIIIQSNFLLLTLSPSNSWATLLGTTVFNIFSCFLFNFSLNISVRVSSFEIVWLFWHFNMTALVMLKTT